MIQLLEIVLESFYFFELALLLLDEKQEKKKNEIEPFYARVLKLPNKVGL